MIILITASLSSNTYNKASLRGEFALEEQNQLCPDHESFHEISFAFEVCEVLHEPHVGSYTSLPVFDYSETCFREELRRSDLRNQVRVYRPINPVSKDVISDSVELCETEVCFLHIQLNGTNV